MEAARRMHMHWLSVFRTMPAWLVVVAAVAGGGAGAFRTGRFTPGDFRFIP